MFVSKIHKIQLYGGSGQILFDTEIYRLRFIIRVYKIWETLRSPEIYALNMTRVKISWDNEISSSTVYNNIVHYHLYNVRSSSFCDK